ncbi:hypothetical protein AOLI_G00061970 [Acnodon oligacanthus]
MTLLTSILCSSLHTNQVVPAISRIDFEDLKAAYTFSIIKRAQQRTYFLRQLRKFNLPQELMARFYTAIIESVITTFITV